MRGQAARMYLRRGGVAALVALAWALAGTGAGARAWARSKPVVDCQIIVHIINDQHQPVANAGVLLDQVANLHRRRVKDALHVELKSDSKGNVTLKGFVPGVVLVQVIAPGYNTFGKYFYVRKAKTVIDVQLVPPGKQVTAFH